ncbi:MAG: bifunctional [glutamine synthetase] adenylyltransferase/[glutamine synthetase]-adenylyl-L-tyrosine phosphorylase [Rhizomicrobium sp.]
MGIADEWNCTRRGFEQKGPLPRVFDAARAERTFEALGQTIAVSPAKAREVLAAAFGNSPYLCRLALREREGLRAIWEDGPDAILDSAVREATRLHEVGTLSSRMAVLRSAKRRAHLAVAFADLAGLWDVIAVTVALTRFADASIGGALRSILGDAANVAGTSDCPPEVLESESGLIVLAMGKAGAFELNYSSDVDLVAFFDTDRFSYRKKGEPRGAAVDQVRQMVKLLGETTADGYVFRVDLRLRPDAGATQIAISTDAAERYYEEMGQNWERAAFIKARPCAGDRAAAASFLKRLEPFVWRRNLDFAAIDDIHSIKRQIHAHGGHGAIAAAGHNVKLGRGGIREIEFFVQTQQLILGGRDPTLRQPGTLDALQALRSRGLVSDSACTELSDAYCYLRQLEHRLQMVEDEQTHTLPRSEAGLAHIACFSGYPDTQRFVDGLLHRLRIVQRHYDGLFERAPSLGSAGRSLAFTGVDDDPETLDTLGSMGFRDAAHISAAVRGWHHGRIRATRSARARELLTRLMPALLDALAATADPDSAFAQFDRFVSNVPAGVQLFSLLLANPELLSLLASIAGSAPHLADDLARAPTMLEAVLDRSFLAELPSGGEFARILSAQLAVATDYETVLDSTRRFAKEQSFRVGAQLIAGRATPEHAGLAFTNIAECIIAALLAETERELASSAGLVKGGVFCVVALGRLGGGEMTAASDIDLIFVYDAPQETELSNGTKPPPPMVYYGRLAQRLIGALTTATAEGRLYEVDMRLRPTGNKGPVAVSIQSLQRYHAQDAWTWERLALTRARVVAGQEELRRKTEAVIRGALTRETDPERLVRETREMRDRLAAQNPAQGNWDLKYANGGLVDIEFVCQYLQLRFAPQSAAVLDPNTVSALERLALAGCLEKGDADVLARAATLQLALLNILRISSAGRFDPDGATRGMKALLVRAGGTDDFSRLEDGLAEAQARARAVFERLLPGP